MKPSEITPTWMKLDPVPGSKGLCWTAEVQLKTPRQVLSFAWDMSRDIAAAWWERPVFFFVLLIAGVRRSRSA